LQEQGAQLAETECGRVRRIRRIRRRAAKSCSVQQKAAKSGRKRPNAAEGGRVRPNAAECGAELCGKKNDSAMKGDDDGVSRAEPNSDAQGTWS
jgi:hypothetical protein